MNKKLSREERQRLEASYPKCPCGNTRPKDDPFNGLCSRCHEIETQQEREVNAADDHIREIVDKRVAEILRAVSHETKYAMDARLGIIARRLEKGELE